MCNVVYLCGLAAYNYVGRNLYNFTFYTHNPHIIFIQNTSRSYTQFCTSFYTRVYTPICVQFTSVSSHLYPISTWPTITTTLNN